MGVEIAHNGSTVPAADFLLAGFTDFINILVALDLVPTSFQLTDLSLVCNGMNGVTGIRITSDPVIRDINLLRLMLADKVSIRLIA